jgi:hypothetical protein
VSSISVWFLGTLFEWQAQSLEILMYSQTKRQTQQTDTWAVCDSVIRSCIGIAAFLWASVALLEYFQNEVHCGAALCIMTVHLVVLVLASDSDD